MPERSHAVSLAAASDQDRIFAVWESAVRATHHFLTEADIDFLIPLVRQALARATPLHCLRDAHGEVYAFLGVAGSNIDMLFVHDDARGRGAGRALVEYAIRELGANTVDVSEQNPLAVGFYEHLGFGVTSRSPLDPNGRPFPVLHMKLIRSGGIA
jgi:putative acetyltransferase